MKRKILALLLVAATAVACLAFTACGDPAPSETYTGTVSEQSYTSSEDAANAFITNEIASSSDVAVYSGSNKEKDLTEEEVEVLNVPQENGKTIDHIEKWKVAYTKSAVQTYAASASAENNYVTVYIIVYKVSDGEISVVDTYEYKYYVPLPENGEALSYSYYASVFNPENYINCTAISNTSSTVKAQGMSVTISVNYKMYITETAAKFEMSVSTFGVKEAMNIYIIKTGSTGKVVVETNGQYSVSSLGDLNLGDSYEDLFASQLTDAEYSFFTKTDYGFKMNTEKYNALLDSLLSQLGGSNFRLSNAKADYYVVEGKLYKTVAELTASYYESGTSFSVSAKAECKYINFGTTTVTIPDQVNALLGD